MQLFGENPGSAYERCINRITTIGVCLYVFHSYQGVKVLTSPTVSQRRRGLRGSVCCRPTLNVACVPAIPTRACRHHLSAEDFARRLCEPERRRDTRETIQTSSLTVIERRCGAAVSREIMRVKSEWVHRSNEPLCRYTEHPASNATNTASQTRRQQIMRI